MRIIKIPTASAVAPTTLWYLQTVLCFGSASFYLTLLCQHFKLKMLLSAPPIRICFQLSTSWLIIVNSSMSLLMKKQTYEKVHEDNARTLTVGLLKPCPMTPRLKHYAVWYHWFWEHIGPCQINHVKIASTDQLGNIVTKHSCQNCLSKIANGEPTSLFKRE